MASKLNGRRSPDRKVTYLPRAHPIRQEIPVYVTCRKCGRKDFRLSRIKPFDLKRLVMLKYPVGCRVCSHRCYASLLSALLVAVGANAALGSSGETLNNVVPAGCIMCGRGNFRLSRIRSHDLMHLLMLQYPVRCETCLYRTFTPIWRAIAMISKRKTPSKVSKTPSIEEYAERNFELGRKLELN